MFRRQSVQQIAAGVSHRAGSDLSPAGLGVPRVGAPGRAPAARAGAGSVGSPELAAAAAHGPEPAQAGCVRGALRGSVHVHLGHMDVRVRVERRLASRADSLDGAVDAAAARFLGVPVPYIRNADSRRDGGRVDSDAAAEGAVEEGGRAAEAAAGEVPVRPAADAADAALLRDAPAHADAADAQVRDVPPAAAALVPQAAPLPLFRGRNHPLTDSQSRYTLLKLKRHSHVTRLILF